MDAPQPRFPAGNAFFNYQLFGGLRPGGSVSFLTRDNWGYAVSAFLSGYVYAAVTYILLRIPDDELGLNDSTSLKNVLALQWTAVLFVGIISDSWAPGGLRRKPYMLLGWILSSMLWLALFLLFWFVKDRPDEATFTLIIVAFLSLIVATNALDIRVIEFSQQEDLNQRGRLLGSYEILRISGQVAMHVLILIFGEPDSKSLLIHLPFPVEYMFLHLAIVCALPLYGLLQNAEEEKGNGSEPFKMNPFDGFYSSRDQLSALRPMSPIFSGRSASPTTVLAPRTSTRFKATYRSFWQSAKQKVIWQLMAFYCLLFFFSLFEFPGVRQAIQVWASETAASRVRRNCFSDIAFVLMIAIWRRYVVNSNWRILTGTVLIFTSFVFAATSSLVVFDVVRDPWITTVAYVLRAPLRVLTLIAAFVPAIEVAHYGAEGTTFALLGTFQNLVKLLAAECVSQIEQHISALQFPHDVVVKSEPSTQMRAIFGVLGMSIAFMIPVLGLLLLPRQKLDAQQLRVYGGYSSLPRAILAFGFLLSFPGVMYLQISRLDE
ncbi:hypothetical protein Poli38472_008189 [Pythium oligandrum]|uniref:Transmembrane protein n=1 Tax=Pythium oligandrum TaxID=41045 RepID=A0A8K1CNC6_PYTOL|nr:hypothetical protein Poli38472_008189 [Pythium oligandrum]|eukprot:TMW65547.1 hypothetical protein Poli38472_008189 [Pythium oligandrum]